MIRSTLCAASAELRVKYAVGQMLRTARKFGLKILVPEELRVRQCPQHAFVARDDGGPAVFLDIGDHDETWREGPSALSREKFRCARIEVINTSSGVMKSSSILPRRQAIDQPHDLVQQAGIVAQAEPFFCSSLLSPVENERFCSSRSRITWAARFSS